jgi:hypothetical protein
MWIVVYSYRSWTGAEIEREYDRYERVETEAAAKNRYHEILKQDWQNVAGDPERGSYILYHCGYGPEIYGTD